MLVLEKKTHRNVIPESESRARAWESRPKTSVAEPSVAQLIVERFVDFSREPWAEFLQGVKADTVELKGKIREARREVKMSE